MEEPVSAGREQYRTKTGRVLAEGELDALVAEAERGYDVSAARDREHVVQVNRGDLAALREWLRSPNGAFTPRCAPRLTFEACAGGVLVRSKPYRAASSSERS